MKKEIAMNKGTVGVIIAASLLLIAITGLAYLNAGSVAAFKELEMEAKFLLTDGGREISVGMEDILALQPAQFETTMRTSTTGATPVTFTGVELRNILENYAVDIEPHSTLQIMAMDGYTSAVTGQEVLEEKNIYLCIAMNGEALKPRSEGGSGPYYLVIRTAEFAQRWCKCVGRIVVK